MHLIQQSMQSTRLNFGINQTLNNPQSFSHLTNQEPNLDRLYSRLRHEVEEGHDVQMSAAQNPIATEQDSRQFF